MADFHDALKILGIEDYGERIFNSNSHGELFHLCDYVLIAESVGHVPWFRVWFESVVAQAEEMWVRPESVFQHIGDLFSELLRGARQFKG